MNILIVKPSSLGDIVHTLPAVHLVRQHFPEALLAWVVNDTLASFLALYSEIDEVIPFRRQRWGRICHWHELGGFFAELRQHRFDLVFDFQGLFRSGCMAMATGAPRRIGFRQAREGAGLFYSERIAVPVNLRHAIDRNVFLVQSALGLASEPTMPALARPHDSVREARRLFRLHHLSGEAPVLAVAPAARWPSKRWPPRFFAAVLDAVQAALPGLRSWLLGTPDEAPQAEAVAQACHRCQPVSLVGQTDLGTLVEALRQSDCLLTNDSGPMHLAAAIDLPTVALFGATDPALTGPYGPAHAVFRAVCDRAPCFARECLRDGHPCADGVDPGAVAAALASRLTAACERRRRAALSLPPDEEKTP